MSITGYLVKRAGNGFVVLQEKISITPQGAISNFSIDNDSSWVFTTWDQAQGWLGMKLTANQEAQVIPLVPPGAT